MKTTYVGLRRMSGLSVYIARGMRFDPLPPRLDLRNHSPTGFECGYGGSGPAQLALALLAHASGDDQLATRLYQDFKWRVVAKLKRGNWRLPQDDVLSYIASIDKTKADLIATLNGLDAQWKNPGYGEIVDLMEDYDGAEEPE